MKKCTKCLKEKSENEFGKAKGYKNGIKSWCRECETNNAKVWRKEVGGWEYTKNLPGAKAWKESGKAWNYEAKKRMDLDYDPWPHKILESQNGCCAICGENIMNSKKNFDHNHITKKPRGILCTTCNVLLGYYEKRKDLINKFEEYLEKYK